MESLPTAGLRESRTAEKASIDEDLDMRILVERLRLLDNQRRMQAASCQRFTDMMEAALSRRSGNGLGLTHSQSQSQRQSQSQSHSYNQQEGEPRVTPRRHSSGAVAPAAGRPPLAPSPALAQSPRGVSPTGLGPPGAPGAPFGACEASDDDGERCWSQPCCPSPHRQGHHQASLRGSASDCSNLSTSQDAREVQQYYQTSQPSARRRSHGERCIRRQQRVSFGR